MFQQTSGYFRTGTQNFNYATKFSQNGGFGSQILDLNFRQEENFPTIFRQPKI